MPICGTDYYRLSDKKTETDIFWSDHKALKCFIQVAQWVENEKQEKSPSGALKYVMGKNNKWYNRRCNELWTGPCK